MELVTCAKCKKEKPKDEFRICRLYKGMEQGAYLRSECISCEQKTAEQLRKAKKDAPPKPDFCDCCGKEFAKLEENPICDHNHRTGAFRGWICRNCNQGIGKLGDNVTCLRRAVKYLLGKSQMNPITDAPLKQLELF